MHTSELVGRPNASGYSTLVRNAQANPYATLPIDDLLAHVRAGVERLMLGGEADRVADREQQAESTRLHVA